MRTRLPSSSVSTSSARKSSPYEAPSRPVRRATCPRARETGLPCHPQTGAHLRLTTNDPSEHHITIPNHDPLRVGTLAAILRDVAGFHGRSRNELIARLFK